MISSSLRVGGSVCSTSNDTMTVHDRRSDSRKLFESLASFVLVNNLVPGKLTSSRRSGFLPNTTRPLSSSTKSSPASVWKEKSSLFHLTLTFLEPLLTKKVLPFSCLIDKVVKSALLATRSPPDPTITYLPVVLLFNATWYKQADPTGPVPTST